MEKSNNRLVRKMAGIMPLLVTTSLILAACGGTSTATPPPATVMPATVMPATAMPVNPTATTGAMMGETPSAGMMSGTTTPGGTMVPLAPLTITMHAQNGSNEDGTATITDINNGMVRVSINLNNSSTTPQPAHIHKGTCATLDPTPLYPLTNVVNGTSSTDVAVKMSDLESGTYAINVHKSATDIATYVSCGDISTAMMGGTPGVMMTGTPGAMMGETPGAMMTGTTTPGAMMAPLTITMNAQNGSGENGTAIITAKGDADVMVSLNIQNAPADAQPAHIHKGTCATLDPTPLYPLTNVVSGKSDTEVMVSMADLEKGPYAINVHKSATDIGTYVSCGDISTAMMGGTPGVMMSGTTTPGSMMSGTQTPGAMMTGTTPAPSTTP